MRKIAILCLLLVGALPALAGSYRPDEIPNVQRMDRRRYVSNPDGILSAGAVARIDSLCASLRERGLAQVAVVAVDDIAGGDAFSFAVELFRSWGVGSAESDNGLGILLVKELREIRFVTGGGLEGILPDALCKRIQLNYMLPAFREGDYSAGMVAGVEAAAAVLEGGEADLSGDGGELPAWMIFVIVVGFIVGPLGLVLAVYYARRRCPKCHKFTLRQDSQRVLSVTHNYRLVEYTYVCPNCGAVVKRQARNLRDDNFGGGAGGGKDRQCGGQQETQQCWPAFLPHGSKSLLRRLKPPGYGRKGPAGSLITVLLAGVLVHAAQKHLVAAELQQLAVLLLVEGDNAPLGIHPHAPERGGSRILLHGKRPPLM